MHQKDSVRINISKSLSLFPEFLSISKNELLSANEHNFQIYIKILKSIVLLLNDEQPDIRYYLI